MAWEEKKLFILTRKYKRKDQKCNNINLVFFLLKIETLNLVSKTLGRVHKFYNFDNNILK